MCEENFMLLCSHLRPFIKKQETNMRKPVSVERQVAVTLHYLSNEEILRKTANTFGIARSTVSIIIRRVTTAITQHLFSQLPLTEEAVIDNVTKQTHHMHSKAQ